MYRTLRNIKTTFMGKEKWFYIGLKEKENNRSFRNTVYVNNSHTKTNHEGETTVIADLTQWGVRVHSVCFLFPCFSISLDIIPVWTNSSHTSLFLPLEEAAGYFCLGLSHAIAPLPDSFPLRTEQIGLLAAQLQPLLTFDTRWRST